MAKRKNTAKNEWEFEALKKRGQAYEKELKKRIEAVQEKVRSALGQIQQSISELTSKIYAFGK